MKLLQLFTLEETERERKDLVDHLSVAKEIGPHSRTDLFGTSQFLAKCRPPHALRSATCDFGIAQICVS